MRVTGWTESADQQTHRLAARSALAEHRAVGEDLDLHEVLVERRACPRRKTADLIRRAVAHGTPRVRAHR
jgi:hypothetical protein